MDSQNEWMDWARCVSHKDAYKFFGTVTQQREAIRKMCFKCPVLENCIEHYSKVPKRERVGAAAGLTESQLRSLSYKKIDKFKEKVSSLASNDGY